MFDVQLDGSMDVVVGDKSQDELLWLNDGQSQLTRTRETALRRASIQLGSQFFQEANNGWDMHHVDQTSIGFDVKVSPSRIPQQ